MAALGKTLHDIFIGAGLLTFGVIVIFIMICLDQSGKK